MTTYSVSHLDGPVVLRRMAEKFSQAGASFAEALACLADADARRLYVPAAYSSMHAYCMGELAFSRDVASKRIQAARTARAFPVIFPALAAGQLQVSGVVLLAPHLVPENAGELVAAAAGKSFDELRVMLAERFRPADASLWDAPAAGYEVAAPLVHEPGAGADAGLRENGEQHAAQHTNLHVAPAAAPAPERFPVHVSLDREAHDALLYARDLLAHAVPSGDVAEVLKRALVNLVRTLERDKFALTSRPRPQRGTPRGRGIPAAIRRAVFLRDGGACTFTSDKGHRCGSRRALQYDHIIPEARGGETTVENLRLRCRVHNQYEAERVFGAGFMQQKREQSRRKAEEVREAKRLAAEAKAKAAERARQGEAAVKEVMPFLRELGFTAAEARRMAARCADIPHASLEERVRCSLRGMAPRGVHHEAPAGRGAA